MDEQEAVKLLIEKGYILLSEADQRTISIAYQENDAIFLGDVISDYLSFCSEKDDSDREYERANNALEKELGKNIEE